ncbi:MAG: transporter substrate-binding domain-containing protein, partial [Lachnospiraceae bacterium]|nr:transporter substrate-binding domain-containing protein [Lachnospiraceae bacterium]
MVIWKQHIAQSINKTIAGLLCVFLIFVSFCPATVIAAETKQTTVRVGYYVNEHFQEGTSDADVKSGYGYEYLRKVAYYSGWKYEYVYGNWADLYEQFLAGKIDIMAGVSKLEEREDYILFPDYEMGIESYYIYKHEEDTEIVGENPSTLSGKKIGVIKNTTMEDSLRNWISEHPVDAEIVEFDGYEKEQIAFDRKEIDVFVEMDFNISTDSGRAAVVRIGELPYYLAVSKCRPNLLAELNATLTKLNEVEPYFRQNLQYSNYGNSLISHMLSETEQEWVRERDVMNVGYFEAYMPYCGTDQEGNATGLLTDVMAEILRKLRIENQVKIRYTTYHSYEEMVADLHTGKLDVAFPVGGELWNAEQDGIYSSSPVVSAGVDLTFIGSYDDETVASIAVNKSNKMQYYYTVSNFPDAKIVFCNTVNDCLDAVLHGKAGSTILNGIRTNSLLSDSKYSTMASLQLSRSDNFCFGVVDGNDDLLLLLNRGIKLIGEDYGINASHKYMTYQYTAADFVRENALLIVVLILFVSAVIIFLLVRETKNRKRYTAEIEKSRNDLADALKTAKEASHAKSTFLFNMSHDIRTPMNAILGFTDLLEKHSEDPGRRSDYIKKIKSSGEFLLSLINNVLEMSRIESGKADLNEMPWSVEGFNDSIYSIFDEQMKAKGIEFIREIYVEHEYVYCDTLKLRELFHNILSNAYKYTPEGGKIRMVVREFPSDREGYAMFQTEISDTGIGISQEYLPHLFEEFSREHTTTESKVKGTGLGMAIVKRLVEIMDGQIEVESELGKGTKFTVSLPHRIADKSVFLTEAAKDVRSDEFNGKRILLAEDNDLNAEIAMELLKDAGFEIERAEDGAVCVDLLKHAESGYYDLILMDIQMPNMNG